MHRLLLGDVLAFARHYRGPRFHALLCDPPYHLTSIVKRFGDGEPEHTQTARDIATRATPYARQAAGFMGKHWDGGDVAFRSETWAALANLLYPGAFIMAFAGTRGYHRMAVAMEDAGLVIHPAIGWLFASGFPKSTRIDTQIDEAEGIEQKTIRPDQWRGYRYGLQALKPAFEFIAVAQKPYQGRPVDSIVETGAGAINVDGGRIGFTDDLDADNAIPGFIKAGTDPATLQKTSGIWGNFAANINNVNRSGRWPANLVLTCSCDLVDWCDCDDCEAQG